MRERSLAVASAALLALAGLVFAWRVRFGLTTRDPFGDETEKFVGAQMMTEGMTLYGDVFAHHGPLPYMLSHLYAAGVSSTDFSGVRLATAIVAMGATVAVATSPVLPNRTARFLAAGLFLALLSPFWIVRHFNFVLYHGLGGLLVTIALAQVTLPALLDRPISRFGAFAAGAALAFGFAAAYSLALPSTMLLGAAGIALLCHGKLTEAAPAVAWFMAGALAAVAVTATWLLSFADIRGYAIYHWHFNQAIYSRFISFSPLSFLNTFVPNPSRTGFVHLWFLVLWLGAALGVITALRALPVAPKRPRRYGLWFAGALLPASLLFMNPRGVTYFGDGAFAIVTMGAASLLLAHVIGAMLEQGADRIGSALMVVALLVLGGESVGAVGTRPEMVEYDPKRALSDEASRTVQALVRPDEPVLALPFTPEFYIHTGRRPASGHYYYLPWQAAYDAAPVAGYAIDICGDIARHRPPVIYFTNIPFWETYRLQDYAPCIAQILSEHYRPHGQFDRLYVRQDRLPDR